MPYLMSDRSGNLGGQEKTTLPNFHRHVKLYHCYIVLINNFLANEDNATKYIEIKNFSHVIAWCYSVPLLLSLILRF